jgi:hypothetical protein
VAVNSIKRGLWLYFIAIFTLGVRLPADTDTWWHLRSGQYIVGNLSSRQTRHFVLPCRDVII